MLTKVLLKLFISPTFAFFIGPLTYEISDAYPQRSEVITHAQKICRNVYQNPAYLNFGLREDLQSMMNAPVASLKVTHDDNGGRIDIALSSNRPTNINILYDLKSSSFTLTLKRPKEEIEPIARINLGTNCSVYQSFSTYYNTFNRPHLRIKRDGMGNEILRIKMEESPANLPLSAEGQLKVGFIDSGLDYNHPTVASKSRPLIGIDLTNPERPPYDYTNTIQNELMGRSFAHGTAVADVATRGLNVHIVPVRIENSSSLSGKAVTYLAAKKVRLVNVSQGSWRQQEWLEFKNAALAHPEMLFIVSAGNESQNIDTQPTYPAGFEIPNMIVVASTDEQGRFSTSFSNYGPNHVHVAAYGERIIAAQGGGGSHTVSGTSFAAPQVTRLAASLLIQNPNLTTEELKEMIFKKAHQTPDLEGKVRFGLIDVF